VTARDPDWALIRTITRLAATTPGGGIHRAELAAKTGAYGPAMRDALFIAYGKKLIDFCGTGYIVRPAKTTTTTGEQRP
jgi:hypothetical protein